MPKPTAVRSTSADCEQDERALIARVRSRDRAAFTELYRLYFPRLYGYLVRLLPTKQVVEEVLDDIMFVVWTDCARFRGRSRLSTWIFGIAYRKALGAMRAERRYRAPLDSAAAPEQFAATTDTYDDSLQTALGELSAKHRQVVVLTYFGGFSYDEIGAIAGCPVSTVKTRMYHARRRLRKLWPALTGATRGGRG